MSIDIFVKTHQAVWHGHSKKNVLRDDESKSDAEIDKVVTAILAHFPP